MENGERGDDTGRQEEVLMAKFQNRLLKGGTVFLSVAIIMSMSTFALWANADSDTQTTLDISKGSISIGDGTVNGYDSAGDHITIPNQKGYILTGSAIGTADGVTIDGASCNITLDNLTICVTGDNAYADRAGAFKIENGAKVNLTLEGANLLDTSNSNSDYGGMEVDANSSVTINGTGTLMAKGDFDCPGIGGSETGTNGLIQINSGTVTTVASGDGVTGCGGGFMGSNVPVIINGGSVNSSVGGGVRDSNGNAEYLDTIKVTGPNGTPLANTLVQYAVDGASQSISATTDANGKLYLWLTQGQHSISIADCAGQVLASVSGMVANNGSTAMTVQIASNVTSYAVQCDASMKNGTVAVDRTSYYTGQPVTLTVEPFDGYRLTTGSLQCTAADGSSVPLTESNDTYTFAMPASNVTVSAEFEALPLHTVSFDANMQDGTLTADLQTARAGTTVTVTPKPADGYFYVAGTLSYTYGGKSYPISSGSFIMPDADVTLSAQFEKNLTVDTQGGSVSTDASGGKTIASSGSYSISGNGVTGGITVAANLGTVNITLDYLNIDMSNVAGGSPFTIGRGTTVNLTVEGTNVLIGGQNMAGVAVPDGAALVIDQTSTGTLNANGNGTAAGIGGNSNSGAGSITINGGTVNASSNGDGAGIGGGRLGGCGTITINGGNVTAQGGAYGELESTGGVYGSVYAGGTGIGGGAWGNGGQISINGGHVKAASSPNFGVSIGNGYGGSGVTVAIQGGTVQTGSATWASVIDAASCVLNGGSIYVGKATEAAQFSANPVNAGNSKVYLDTVMVCNANGSALKNTDVTYSVDGSSDVVASTDAHGMLYLWLSNDDHIVSVHSGDEGGSDETFVDKSDSTTDSITLVADDFTVTVADTAHGAVTASKTVATGGDTVKLTVTPDNGYFLKSLTYNDGTDHDISENADGSYSFTMPEDDVTISAQFEQAPCIVTVSSANANEGTVAVSGASSIGNGAYLVNGGSSFVLSAISKQGYTFSGWYDGNTKVSDAPTFAVTPSAGACYNAVFTAIPSESLTVDITGFGSVSANGVSVGSGVAQSFTLGSSATLTETPADGYQFLYWQDTTSGKILSQSASYTFTMDSDMYMTAVFEQTKTATHMVTFVNGITGETIKSVTVDNSVTDISSYEPADPYAFGCTFKDWKETKEADGSIVETAEFTPASLTDSLTVTGGTQSGSGSYAPKSVVTVTADAAPSGKQFSCWQDASGNILSYGAIYSFCITGDLSVTAVYVDSTSTVEPEADTTLTGVTPNPSAATISFSSQWYVPGGCTMVSHGILVTKGANHTADTFVIGAESVLKATAKNNPSAGTYVVNKCNVTKGDLWYGRAYLVYRDAFGNIVTIYGNILSGSF
ncbi:hypothetical protein CXP51_04315 [Ethanoligenens harbinense]|nr:hypothetical protein CXQ68_04460 [Ethanoligenens harbinense YUAN-3]AYF38214.1 hypothetical protein CXP51_04315 [Ethanoligenens harbinense]AYF40959.1 hypothetical protein CN246_04450 [Ethanoligenens harbinense]